MITDLERRTVAKMLEACGHSLAAGHVLEGTKDDAFSILHHLAFYRENFTLERTEQDALTAVADWQDAQDCYPFKDSLHAPAWRLGFRYNTPEERAFIYHHNVLRKLHG